MTNVPIDWASVNWLYVILLALLVFLSTLIGNFISFRRSGLGAVLSALLFSAGFVFWTYYPHTLPLPTSPVRQGTIAPPPPSSSPSEKPGNTVKDVAPPSTDTKGHDRAN